MFSVHQQHNQTTSNGSNELAVSADDCNFAFKYDKIATVNWLGLNGWPAYSMQLVHIEQQHYIKPSNDRLTTK